MPMTTRKNNAAMRESNDNIDRKIFEVKYLS